MRRGIICFGLLASLIAVAVPANAVQQQAEFASRPGPTNFDTPPRDAEEAKAQMRRMIQDDYAAWTGGGQRDLTIDDIGRLQREPSLIGAQAALIGSLALALDWRHGLVDRISMNELLDVADDKPVELRTSRRFDRKSRKPIPQAVKLKDWAYEYQKEFANLASNVSANGLTLWGSAGGPSVRGIYQGQIGDCYFMSGLEAVVLKRPELIKRTVQQVGPDEFELHFAGRQNPMRVRVTEGDMSQFNTDRNNGCWIAAIGLAESRIRDEQKKSNQFFKETTMGGIDRGGSQCQVLHLLTGHKYRSVSLEKASDRRIRDLLAIAMQRNIPVGLTSSDHTLSIKDFNPQSDMVLVLNPWGTSDKYKLPKSDVHVQMQNGFFEIPLGEMRRCFATINVPEGLAKE